MNERSTLFNGFWPPFAAHACAATHGQPSSTRLETRTQSFRYSFCKKLKQLGAWGGLLLMQPLGQALSAQGLVTFEATVDQKEVVVGVPFELMFTLKNAEGTRFSPPGFPGFKTGRISEMRSGGFMNGRSITSQTWSLELTAAQTGSYNIGPATVQVSGKTMSTNPLVLKVIAASSSKKGNVSLPPGADDRVFVAGEFNCKEAYVGQQVTWRIRLYTQLSVEGYDIIALPSFEGFFTREKVRYDKRVEYLSIRGKKYAVRTLHEEAIFPQETGELTVEAARVSVGIEQPGAQGFLFGPKPVTLQTQPGSLKVKVLPAPQPADFSGAVGQYEWSVEADSTQLTTDDALTLIVEVKGNGDARRFAPPKIVVPANCEIFEPRVLEEEEYESESGIFHRKKLEYVVLPKDTGQQEIVPSISYFDPDSNRFCQIKGIPIRLSITPGKNFQAAPLSVTPIDKPEEHSIGWLGSPVLWGIAALPLLALGIFALKRKRPNATPRVEAKGSQVPAAAHLAPPAQPLVPVRQRLAQAGQFMQQGEAKRFYETLFKSLQTWLSTHLNIQQAQMNDTDISKLLLSQGATPIRTQALLSVWHTCEQAIYGGQASTEQMESTWQMASQVLEALEREIRPMHR